MTVKETLVEALRAEGHGFFEACEWVTRWLDEHPNGGDVAIGGNVYSIGHK